MENPKTKTPIIDKNGKQTHVWKVQPDGRKSLQRVSAITHTGVSSVSVPGEDVNPLGNYMDNLWEVANKTNDLHQEILVHTHARPQTNGYNYQAWVKRQGELVEDVLETAKKASEVISDFELELSAHELEGNKLYLHEDYEVGIQELVLQKDRIESLIDDLRFDPETEEDISFLVTSTREKAGRRAGFTAEEGDMVGEPTLNSDGSLTYEFKRQYPVDNGQNVLRASKSITVGRLGNVIDYTDFDSGEKYRSENINFPERVEGGNWRLKGDGTNLGYEAKRSILFISTGRETFGDFVS